MDWTRLDFTRRRGRPRVSWTSTVKKDLELLGMTWEAKDLWEWRNCTARCAPVARGRTKVRLGNSPVLLHLIWHIYWYWHWPYNQNNIIISFLRLPLSIKQDDRFSVSRHSQCWTQTVADTKRKSTPTWRLGQKFWQIYYESIHRLSPL